MRVLLSRLLPVGGLPVVFALFINHYRLCSNLIIKFIINTVTMDTGFISYLIVLTYCDLF